MSAQYSIRRGSTSEFNFTADTLSNARLFAQALANLMGGTSKVWLMYDGGSAGFTRESYSAASPIVATTGATIDGSTPLAAGSYTAVPTVTVTPLPG